MTLVAVVLALLGLAAAYNLGHLVGKVEGLRIGEMESDLKATERRNAMMAYVERHTALVERKAEELHRLNAAIQLATTRAAIKQAQGQALTARDTHGTN